VETSNILSVVRHWGWALVLAAILAGLSGHLAASALPVSHESRVRLLVGPVTATSDEIRAAGDLARTYGELVTSEALIEGVLADLDLPYSINELRSALRPTADSNTRTLIVRVRDLDPDRAAVIADAMGEQLIQLTEGGAPAGQIQVIDRAGPGVPIGVSTTLIVALAGFAGLAGALILVILLENLRQTVRSAEELAEVTSVDYLGAVTMASRPTAPRGLVLETHPESSRASEYRMLATKTELIAGRDNIRSLLVLGVGGAQGSGELAANLAKGLSERRHSVTLLDANDETREVTELLGLGGRPGLTELLGQFEQFEDAEMHPGASTFSRDPRLFVVPFGRSKAAPSLHTSGAPWVMDLLLSQADFLLINAAPAHRSAASLVWAGGADATLLVVPRNRVKRAELAHLVESLRLVGSKPIGVVFEERHRLLWSMGGDHPGGIPSTDRWRPSWTLTGTGSAQDLQPPRSSPRRVADTQEAGSSTNGPARGGKA
jgi:polysaccharide biosynthesis transport protein